MKLKIKFNARPFFNYISIILATSFAFTLVLISLPLTERVSENTPFNLTVKDDQYWSKEYVLKLNTTENKDAEIARDIIYRRLVKFGVEKISVRNYGVEEDATKLQVIVNTTKDEELVKEMISNRFDVQIVTRKDDVDFEDDEDQFAYLFADNYNLTGWERSDFRNIYVTELKTNDGTDSSFAIFKLWPNRQGEFESFLDEYKGEYIGVSIDGFVTPYMVPFEDQGIFAVPLSTQEEEQIKAISILYNTGIIPVNYTLEDEIELEPQIVQLDHVRVSIGIAIALVLTYVYLWLLRKDDVELLKRSFIATVLTMGVYLSVLKLFNIPIDTFLLPISSILMFVLVKVLAENKDSITYIDILLLSVLLVLRLLGLGFMGILATQLIVLVLISRVSLFVTDWYLYKVKSI